VAHNLRVAAGQLWVFSATDVQVTALLLVAWKTMHFLYRSIDRLPLPLHVRQQHRLQLRSSHPLLSCSWKKSKAWLKGI